MNELALIDNQTIQNKIYTIRNMQVMLDKDLALMYEIKPTRLREQVRRNDKKFPLDFMFELTENEVEYMVSQNAIPSKQHLGGGFPLVFTEQGVSMLATVLRSDIAIDVSIKVIRAFVEMRKFISSNADMFLRFERVEERLSLHDEKFNKIFDAYLFVSDIIKSAKSSIKLIDNYIDETTLILFTKRDAKVEIEKFDLSHDRFLIIDEKEIYHFGASLKDLGKKWFAVSKMDIDSFEIIRKLK